MPVVDLKTRIDPNIQIRNYLNRFFRQQREDLEEAKLRERLNISRNDAPLMDDFRLFGSEVSLDLGKDWESSVALLRSDGNVDPEISDLDRALSAKLDVSGGFIDSDPEAVLYFKVLFHRQDKELFYTPHFAELKIGLTSDGGNYFKPYVALQDILNPVDDGKIKFYTESNSNGEHCSAFTFFAQTHSFKRPVEDIKFSMSLSGSGGDPSGFSGLTAIKPMVALGVETFRVYASKRIEAVNFTRESMGVASAIDAIETGRHMETSGKLAISFFELRGEKDPYTGCATTVFVFRCWGSPESDARALWMLLDQALHNRYNEYWGDLLVYSSVRRDMPELSLGDELRHLDAFNFMCAYDVTYWEYDEDE